MRQNFLAEKVGVKQATLSDWEHDRTIPKVTDAYKVADILNVDVRELYKEEWKMSESPKEVIAYLQNAQRLAWEMEGDELDNLTFVYEHWTNKLIEAYKNLEKENEILKSKEYNVDEKSLLNNLNAYLYYKRGMERDIRKNIYLGDLTDMLLNDIEEKGEI